MGGGSRRFGDSRTTLIQVIDVSEPSGDPVYGDPHIIYNSHCDDASYLSSVRLDESRLFTVYYDACYGYIGGNFVSLDTLRP